MTNCTKSYVAHVHTQHHNHITISRIQVESMSYKSTFLASDSYGVILDVLTPQCHASSCGSLLRLPVSDWSYLHNLQMLSFKVRLPVSRTTEAIFIICSQCLCWPIPLGWPGFVCNNLWYKKILSMSCFTEALVNFSCLVYLYPL